jgi:zinc transport system substrate-binding protein
MDELDLYLKEKLAPYKGNTIFVYHPSFGYFTDEYGLYQEAVETGGKEPVPAILESIIEEALEEKVKIIFVQPEFSQKSAEAIAKGIGGKVISLNPLNPDYLNNMKAIADEIEGALKDGGKL